MGKDGFKVLIGLICLGVIAMMWWEVGREIRNAIREAAKSEGEG